MARFSEKGPLRFSPTLGFVVAQWFEVYFQAQEFDITFMMNIC
jgi:hypothetical protein